MLKSRFNIPIYNAANALKSKWVLLVAVVMISATSNAQLSGYNWTFGDASNTDFISTPAVTGSTATHTLSKMGGGSFSGVISDNVGLGTNCTGPILVRPFIKSVGLEFLNDLPRIVTNLYSIEMVINLSDDNIVRRLIGFYDLSGPTKDYGVYVSATGTIDFYNGTHNYITPSPLAVNTWYHLMFVRDASNIISYYRNGVLIGTYDDNSNQFMPHPEPDNYNIVTFFKDDTGEESSGKIARMGVYNEPLPLTSIQECFNNICSTGVLAESWNTAGNSGTTASSFIGTKDNQPLIFKVNNTEAFRVSSSGQVAIGTTNPYTYKLAVGGNIIAEKITVKQLANWPDYVFDKKYQLPSLKEIEAYISKNNHLPGIPSAAEVEEKGIDIGDQQAMLLKKIEELTLHLISINKQVEKLTQENEGLKKKVEEAGKKIKR